MHGVPLQGLRHRHRGNRLLLKFLQDRFRHGRRVLVFPLEGARPIRRSRCHIIFRLGRSGVTKSNILNIHFCAFCKRSYSTVTYEGGRSREGRRCENDCDSNRALSQLVVGNAAEDAAIRSCTVLRKNRTWSVFFGERYERYDDDERYDERGGLFHHQLSMRDPREGARPWSPEQLPQHPGAGDSGATFRI